VIKPEFRRKGIGMELTNKCMKYLGERNVGLDGVVGNEKKYQKVMKFKSSYSNLQFEGRGEGEVPDGLVTVSAVPFESLLEYNRKMFPAPRLVFLEK
jgi:hypothetical protein